MIGSAWSESNRCRNPRRAVASDIGLVLRIGSGEPSAVDTLRYGSVRAVKRGSHQVREGSSGEGWDKVVGGTP
jgi:hypothetical protein